MRKTREDLTIDEVLHDPMIAMVMRADGVRLDDFKQLLESAARRVEQPKTTARDFLGALASRVAAKPANACCYP